MFTSAGKLIWCLILFCESVWALDQGTGGFGTTGYTVQNLNDKVEEATSAAYYSNGQLVVVGYANNGADNDFAVIRLYPDGTLDSSFGSAGQVTTDLNGADDIAYGVVIDNLGRIILAGQTMNGTHYDFGVVRYNVDGSLDTKFSTTGKNTTDFGGTEADIATCITTTDVAGDIVAAGYRDVGSSNFDFAIARFKSNGALDTKFGSAGLANEEITATDQDIARGVIFHSTTKRYILYGNTKTGSAMDFAIMRLNSNAVLETKFSADGKATTDLMGTADDGYAGDFDSLLRTVVVGQTHNGSNYDFSIVRYQSNGALDTAFASAGTHIVSINANQDDVAKGVWLFGSSTLLVAGQMSNGSNTDLVIARFHSNGDLDTHYDTDGKYTADLSTKNDNINKLAWDNSHYFTAIGSYDNGSNADFLVARVSGTAGLAKSGDRNSFLWGSDRDAAGVITINSQAGEDRAWDLDFQQDGKIVMAVDSGFNMPGVARLTAQGDLDVLTFGSSQGVHFYSGDILERFYTVKLNLNNRLITGGRNWQSSVVHRFETNGEMDTKFNGGGFTVNTTAAMTRVIFQSSGNRGVYIGNVDYKQLLIYRIRSNGSFDSTFSSANDGNVAIVYSSSGPVFNMEDFQDITFASDANIVFCGPRSCGGGYVGRLETNGFVDTGFGSDGLLELANLSVNNCSQDTSGRIVLVGQVGGRCAAWRIQADGTTDTTFGSAGSAEVDWASGPDKCGGGATQSGKIMIGGRTSIPQYNFRYTRLLSNGVLDAPFASNPAADDNLFYGSGAEMNRVIVSDRDMLWIVGEVYGSSSDWAIQSIYP